MSCLFQGKPKRTALSFATPDIDGLFVRFHYMLYDGKPKACAARIPGAVLVNPIEPIKHMA